MLTSLLTVLALSAFNSTADVLSVSQAVTRAHLDAESCLRVCLSELRKAGVGTGTPSVSSSGLQAADPVTGLVPDDVITFTHVTGIDPGDPRRVVWGETYRLQFEADGAETLNDGVDDDADGRVDEGRVVLYRVDTSAGTATEVSVIAHEVSRFIVELLRGAPGGLQTVVIRVYTENVVERAVRSEDTRKLGTGGGPRTRYTAHGSVALFN